MTEPDYYELHRKHRADLARGVYDAAREAQLREMHEQRRAERAREVQAQYEREMGPVLAELMTLREPIPNQGAFQRPTDADIKEMHAIWQEYNCDPARIRDIAAEMGLKTLVVRRALLGNVTTRKLTAEQVREMRRLYDASDKSRGVIAAIARQFGVCLTTARDVVYRKKWRDVV